MGKAAKSWAVELRPIASLVAYANNARTHSAEQIAQIQASFRKFGVNTPIGVDADGIMVGHGRVLAMEGMWKAGETVYGPGKREALPRDMVPTLDLSGLTAEERRAYIVADNQLALNAGWDIGILKNELLGLEAASFDLGVLGFNIDDLADLLAKGNDGRTDPDDAPPLPEHPVSVAGDLWILGKHRLLCGSATVGRDVERVLDGEVPNLMVTDPPYGVDYDPAWRNETGKDRAGVTRHKGSGKVIKSTETRATGRVQNDHQADWREAWALFPGAVAYVWNGGLHEVAASLKACRLIPRAQIIWVKGRMALGRGHYHWKHEACLYVVAEEAQDDGWQSAGPDDRFEQEHDVATYAVRKGEPASWRGGRKQTTVWNIDHLKSDTGHGTQKPVECMKRPILNNSGPGQSVYDPFLGSGTTIIAGEMTDRRVLALEIDPAYVDVAVKRWQAFTGLAAVLAPRGDGVDAFAGRTFDEVAEGRSPTPGGPS